MKRILIWLLTVCASVSLLAARNRGIIDTSESPYAKLRSFDADAITWNGGFWGDRFGLVRDVALPRLWEVMQDPANGANMVNLRIAAGVQQGQFRGTNWSDGDVYKAIETMAAVYMRTKDPKLDRWMDDAIAVIAKAQSPDGYIGTQTQVGAKQRWGNINYHELYNMGHLITAACIHQRATGKDSLLNVAKKAANYLYRVFKPRPPELAHFCFNPSQIMGLVELYRVTREPRYLELANIFVDMRGSQPGGTDENQTRIPLRQETEAVGHSVTGAYLWAGAADVYAETGEKTLFATLERLWTDVVYRKMYVTGGIAAINHGVSGHTANFHHDPVWEAFGFKYQLPNTVAYNETCANLAHAMWSWRMLGITAEARYADVVEQVMYNAGLSGWGLDGKSYGYTNPLRRYGKEDGLMQNESIQRWESSTDRGAPTSYCCPPSMTRTVAEFSGWAYSWSDKAVWVNFYGANSLKTTLADGTRVDLLQETAYPWEGSIKFTINQPSGTEFALMLRIPGWAQNPSLTVNGKPAGVVMRPQTYAAVRRRWSAGDKVELDLGMQPALVEGNPKIEEVRNQVAVTRGPIVYCLESPDLPPGVRIDEVAISAAAKFTPRYDPKLLSGVTVLEGEGLLVRSGEWSGLLYRPLRMSAAANVRLRLIPYYAWGNRSVPYMTVWLPLAR